MLNHINQEFKKVLDQEGFAPLVQETEEECLYRGKLEVSNYQVVDFAISISNNTEGIAIYQIVYNNIAFCNRIEDQPKCVELMNKLNQNSMYFFYLYITPIGEVVMRHVGEVQEDVGLIYNIFKSGVAVLKQIIPVFEEELGESIVF